MTEQERIEEINSEQLATATDRVLLAARFGRARPSSPRLSRAQLGTLRSPSGTQLGYAPAYHAPRGSQPRLYSNGLYVPQSDAPLYAPQAPARGSSPQIHLGAISRRDDHTVLTRPAQQSAWWKFATTALVTSLISVATAIALLV